MTLFLIESLRVPKLAYDSTERLRKMIDRKPARAGQLAATLNDDNSKDEQGRQIGDILAFVSGYSNLWAVKASSNSEPVKITNKWWREWWNRNKDRDIFGWLEESISIDNEEHKTTVLQRMSAIKDKRALPYFLKALDSPRPDVQYWGVTGLQGLDVGFQGKQLPYTYEAFLEKKDGLVLEFKKKYVR